MLLTQLNSCSLHCGATARTIQRQARYWPAGSHKHKRTTACMIVALLVLSVLVQCAVASPSTLQHNTRKAGLTTEQQHQQLRRCGTDVPSRAWQVQHHHVLQTSLPWQAQQQSPDAAGDTAQHGTLAAAALGAGCAHQRVLAAATQQQLRIYSIPTYVHVVVVTDPGVATGNVSQQALDSQMALMNRAYSSNAAAAGIEWNFQVMNVTYSTTTSEHDMCSPNSEQQIKQQLRQGGKDALNLYITDLSACGVLGYSTWPWDMDTRDNGMVMDGVVTHYKTLPGGGYQLYNLGGTAVHETGHWLGLFHTFENGCVPPGDWVDDTPYCTRPDDVYCPAHRDSCPQPGEDPVDNWMGYGVDKCMKTFTVGQQQRIEHVWKRYRTV